MNKNEILSYIKTFAITCLILSIIVGLLIISANFSAKKPPTKKQITEFKTTQISMLIDSYKFQESQNPGNYEVNLKLGLAYETIGEYKLAESQYLVAINKAPYSVFEPTFQLATLYLKQGKLEKAIDMIAKVKEYANDSLIRSKAIFYAKAARAYCERENYELAKAYFLNALYYQNKTDTVNFNVKDELPQVYMNIVTVQLKANKKNRAINTLLSGISITDSPVLMYHLAKLYSSDNPEEALIWFEKTAKKNPYIINYSVYKKTLLALVSSSRAAGDLVYTNMYLEKYKKLNRFILYNILDANDLTVKVESGAYKALPFGIASSVNADISVQNNTEKTIHKLYLIIKVYDNNHLCETIVQRIATQAEPIKPGETSKNLHINAICKKHETKVMTKDIMLSVSAKKSIDIPPVFLENIYITKVGGLP
ncbi:MAG: hypothetical protein PHV37_00750 [Candidatus Gastranaerophilales bacterium]|nr:hypothetical protein [Candidatus Gastranaerophilales bacterium]